MMFGLPPNSAMMPLPSGWTEHVGTFLAFVCVVYNTVSDLTTQSAPTGQPYFYNAFTNESTFVRPMPSYPLPAAHPLPSAPPLKKEKPLYKIPVPGSPWIRIKTTHHNIFFSHSETKESVWTVPEDIADVVASLDWDLLEEEAAQQKEITRLQKEVERDNLKRKATVEDVELVTHHGPDDNSAPPKKRKKRVEVIDEAPVAIDEIVVARDDAADEVGEEGDDDEEEEDGSEAAFSTSSAEDAWQREMAEGMAKLAADEAAAAAGEPVVPPTDPAHSALEAPEADVDSAPDEKAFAVPKQVNLSHEEARTLFKVCCDVHLVFSYQ